MSPPDNSVYGVEQDSGVHSDTSRRQKENESPNSSLNPNASPRSVHGWRWAAAVAALYVGALIYGLDGTIAANIQTSIIEEFGNVEKLTWIGTAFPLGSVCAILPGASLYTIFNLKAMFIGSIVLFEAASALCGAAPTMEALIIGRAFAGVGGTGIFLGILNYFSLCTTEQERGRYISGIGVVWGLGAVLGPVVGGAFATSSATWRWGFYINLAVAAICAPVYILYLPPVTPNGATDTPILQKLKDLDWTGFVGGTGAAVSLTMVLTFAGSSWNWNDGRTIAMFVVSGALLILTLLQQRFAIFTTHETRMFPPQHILLSRTQMLLGCNTALAATNIFVPIYYIPLYFAFTKGDSELMAAVRLLPFICFLATLNMASGSLLPRVNYYWGLYLIGGVLMTIGSATMFTVTPDTPMANVYGYSIILGAGTGLVNNLGFTVAGVTIMAETGNGLNIQRVISMQNLSQLGFQTLSLLIGGQIFQSLSMRNLTQVFRGLGFSQAEIRSVITGTRSALFARLTPALQEEAIAAITNAMSRVYILSIAAGAITTICALLMKKEKLFPIAGEKMVIAGGA
ncbi:putative efflux pump antibiotic resistance protein [Dothidotthia symphoricarpi CBS 119687]|uniref:Putative efflux pump antibiotic resistance protein n=1 Tax=Dothidotthia symphoricarpi CBS 119687 TaxID=1392245 RepID=A0A6A6ALR7_9PLEO|nr:putative efflux pump antibiotic resistance protein [Dothidotthia symphoricarpi CBS 119687]KAF2132025.1 putative efflux pump antibiotic resistance protein [Dothidotthia symphoricarpi CBS 119687]